MSILFYDSLKLTPGRISGLSAWYDTSAAAYLRNGSAVAPSAGEGIAQMLDRSGNGNHTAVQATSTKRPTWTANQLNSLPLAVFDNGDTLAMPSALYSIPNGNNTVFSVSRQSTTGALDYLLGMTEATSGRWYIQYEATAGQMLYESRTADANGVRVTGVAGYNSVTAFRSGTTQSISSNGGTPVTNAFGASESGVDSAYIGSKDDTANYLTGEIAEVLIYNRALSAAEILQVEVYLANKWGIYNPNATWITAYTSAQQAFIRANRLNKDALAAIFSSIAVWYKMDTANVTLVGSAITQMLDISGNGNHTSVQGTSTKRPTFNATGINSRGLATFDGGDALALPSALFTIPNGDNATYAVANRTTAAATQARIASMSEGGSTRFAFGYTAVADTIEFQNRTAAGTSVTASVVPETAFAVFNAYRSGTTQSIQVNNGVAVTDANALSENNITEGSIGAAGLGASLFLGGGIAEVIIQNRAPTVAEIIYFNTYLGSQYAITIS